MYLQQISIAFSVIILSETWLSSVHELIDIPGYAGFHSIREGWRGGGVSIFVKSSLSSDVVTQLSVVNEYYENIAVKLHINGKSYTVLGTYRPPSASLTHFNDLNFQNLDTLNDRENILVLGDFNVDLLSESLTQSKIKFFDEFSTRHLMPLINIPTRVSPTSS